MSQPSDVVDILLLEDEAADAYLIKMAFKEHNLSIRLHHVLDGREGLNFLNQQDEYTNAPCPDLIFLDLNMPRMNGYEFLAEIKKDARFKQIPVIILTTSDIETDITYSYQLGAASYITKPTGIDQFMSVIYKTSEYWTKIVRLPQRYQHEK